MSTLSKANLEGLPAGSQIADGDGDHWVKTADGRWALTAMGREHSYAVTATLALFIPITLVEV